MKQNLTKILIISLILLSSNNIYSKDLFLFDFYGYIHEYQDPTYPSFNNQIELERTSNFIKIYNKISQNKNNKLIVSTIASDSIGDISKKIIADDYYQCSLFFDDFIRYFNGIFFKNSKNNKSHFLDIDKITNFSFTTCPIGKYYFLKEKLSKNYNNIYFFINSHKDSIKIVEKLILTYGISNYKIFIKNYHFLEKDFLISNNIVFDQYNTILFLDENDILDYFYKEKDSKPNLIFRKGYFYNSFKNYYIKKYSDNKNLIKEEFILKEFEKVKKIR